VPRLSAVASSHPEGGWLLLCLGSQPEACARPLRRVSTCATAAQFACVQLWPKFSGEQSLLNATNSSSVALVSRISSTCLLNLCCDMVILDGLASEVSERLNMDCPVYSSPRLAGGDLGELLFLDRPVRRGASSMRTEPALRKMASSDLHQSSTASSVRIVPVLTCFVRAWCS